jgi:hypothetical protein
MLPSVAFVADERSCSTDYAPVTATDRRTISWDRQRVGFRCEQERRTQREIEIQRKEEVRE